MAYVGATPWHSLGQALSDSATFDDWTNAAGFGFTIERAPVTYTAPDGTTRTMDDRFVLCRSDDGMPISVMSDRYKIVQPAQVLDFFNEVCTKQDWAMETAGVLKGGAQYWALARTLALMARLTATSTGCIRCSLLALMAVSRLSQRLRQSA